MCADYFFDTNILVYAIDSSFENENKQKIARHLIGKLNFGLSTQVLQEFYVVVTTKLKSRLSVEEAVAVLDRFTVFPILPIDYALINVAVKNSLKYQISYWDAAIIAAAEALNVHTLLSEDLNHRQKYGSVTVINPFKEGEDEC